MAATMRVRQSPFGGAQANATPAANGGPAAAGTAAPAPDDMNFDWMEQEFASPAPQPTLHQQGLPPQPRINPQQQNAGYPQPVQPPQPVGQPMGQQMQSPQQSAWGPAGMSGGMEHGIQGSAALLAGSMGAMGMNSMMANVVADRFANEIQGSGMTRWFPMLFLNLQHLFSVGHSFVLRKLLLLLCPFVKKKDAGSSTSWGDSSNNEQKAADPDGLKADTEDPDLYIPCMAYVTYVLLYALQRGMLKEFSPEILSSTFSFALVLFILEVGVFYMAFYFAGSPVPVLMIGANAGYKYFHVFLMVLCRIFTGGSLVYYILFAYLAASSGWSVRRFMLHIEPSQVRQQYGMPPSSLTQHIVTAMAVAQVPICWLLTPSTA